MAFLEKLLGRASRPPFSKFEEEAAALASQGLHKEAAAVWERAASAYPDSLGAHNNLSRALLLAGQKERALGPMIRALQIAPKDSDLHRNYGIVLMENGKLQDAVTQFQIAHIIDPDNWAAYLNLAEAHEKLGNREEMIHLTRYVFDESLKAGAFAFHAEALKRLRAHGVELASPPTRTLAELQFLELDVETQKDIIKGYFRIFGRAWLTNGYKGGEILCDSCSNVLEPSDVFYNNTDHRVRCPTCMDVSLHWWAEERADFDYFGNGVIADAIKFNKRFSAM